MKLFLVLSLIIFTAFLVFTLYCAFLIAGRSDKISFPNEHLCPKCKTGKETYELDNLSDNCPYLGCYKNNKCLFFVPFENSPDHK